MTVIRSEHLVQSVADALQFISCYHARDYTRAPGRAYERKQSARRQGSFEDAVNTGPAEWSKKIIELKLPVTAA